MPTLQTRATRLPELLDVERRATHRRTADRIAGAMKVVGGLTVVVSGSRGDWVVSCQATPLTLACFAATEAVREAAK